MKKIYNVLLTFLLICTLIPINVSAEGEGDFSTPTDTNITETDSSVVETNSNEDLGDDNINTTQDEMSSETLENASDDELAQEVEINQENNEETEILEEKVEENYPIFNESKTIDGVVISVIAEEGVFPEGSKLSVEKVVYYVQKQVDNALDEVRNEEANVVASYTFDIKILDSEGNEIQPKDDSKVKVSFTLSEVTNDNLDTNVYHIDDKQEGITSNNVQTLDVVTEGEDVIVETNGFSIYTVEFTYNNKEYVLDGDNYIKLYDLLAHIGLNGEVSSWEVSNPSLFNIFRGTEDEVSYDYEIIDEYIYDFPVDNPDGDVLYIVPLQMFNTEEWLKVTIDGIEYEIKVTDDNIYQTVPASYSGNISTNNDDNVAITGDTYFLDAPKPDYVMQSQSTTSARDFAAGLPLSTIFIDVDKIGNDGNIGVQGEFKLLTENEAIKNGFEHHYTTDGSGGNAGITGDVVVYNPLVDTENLMQIEPNKINVLEGDLFQFIYRDAAILPNGSRAHVKIVYSNAKIAVDQRLGVTDTASGLTASNYQGAIYLVRGGTVARGGTDNRYMGYKDQSTTTYPNQPFTQAQRKAMQEAVDDTLSTNWGQSFSTGNANTADTIALGQSIDVKYQVVDDDGNPVDGTFIFAVTGINLDRDPYSVSGNNICKPIWSYTVDNPDVHFFSEAMSIKQGKVSDYIYVRPNTNLYDNPAITTVKGQYYYAQVIEDTNGHVKFIGNGYGPTNLGGDDASYNAGFVVLANAKDGITVTSTGHATTKQGMNTQAWGGVQIWYRYTSSTGPNGNIQTTSEGNYGGTLDDTSDHGVSSNILDPNTFVVPEGKTVTYTLTPDTDYQIAKLQVANANGTMREIKYNGNKPLSSMQEGATYRFNDAAGRQCVLTALADGKFTLEVPYATHDEIFHVEWRRNNASVKIKKDTVDNKEGTFTFKIKAYKKSDVTTYSPILVGSIWKDSETGNYETSFIDDVTVNLTPDEIATILADATIDTKQFITDADYTWGSYLGQTNINLSDIGVTYGEDDTLFVGFENLPTSLIGDNVGYALNTGYGAAGQERIYLYHPSTNVEKDVMTYWNFNSLKGQSSNPGWYTFNVSAGEEEELTVEEGYTYEVQEVNDANWQLLDIDGNPIQTASGELTSENRNPSHDFLNREVPDLTIKKETVNNVPGTFEFKIKAWTEEDEVETNRTLLGYYSDYHNDIWSESIDSYDTPFTLLDTEFGVNDGGSPVIDIGLATYPPYQVDGRWYTPEENRSEWFDFIVNFSSYVPFPTQHHYPKDGAYTGRITQEVADEYRNLGLDVIVDGKSYPLYGKVDEQYVGNTLVDNSFYGEFGIELYADIETKTGNIIENYIDLSEQLGEPDEDGYYHFTLNNDGSLTIPNLPYGCKYEVIEIEQDGWRLTNKINNSGALEGNTTAKFTNEKLLSLTIRKETDENTGEEFNFVIDIGTPFSESQFISYPEYHTGGIDSFILGNVNSSYLLFEDLSLYDIETITIDGVEISVSNNPINDADIISHLTSIKEDTENEHFATINGYTYEFNINSAGDLLINDREMDLSAYFGEPTIYIDSENPASREYKFTLQSGEEVVIKDIPYGSVYYINETDSEGNYIYIGESFGSNNQWYLDNMSANDVDILKDSKEIIFSNKIKRGSIKINKETKGNEEGEFNFKVKVWKETVGYNYNNLTLITHMYNEPSDDFYGWSVDSYHEWVNEETGEFIKHDIYWNGIRVSRLELLTGPSASGTYMGYEYNTHPFTQEYLHGDFELIPFLKTFVYYVDENNIEHNTETYDRKDTGEKITIDGIEYPLIVSGYGHGAEHNYQLFIPELKTENIFLDLSDYGGIATSEEGVYEFTINNGENFVIDEIPFGYKYEVYEETPEGWDLVSIDGFTPREKAEGTIESEEPYEHTFLNAKRHKLVFEKKVSGNMGDKYKEFEFVVTIHSWKTIYNDEIKSLVSYGYDGSGTIGGVKLKNPDKNRLGIQNNYKYNNACGIGLRAIGDNTPLKEFFASSDSPFHEIEIDYTYFDEKYIGATGNDSSGSINFRGKSIAGMQYYDYLDLSEYGGYSSVSEPCDPYNDSEVFYTFKLKHGDKIEIEVPYGYTYEIYEEDYSDIGYKQSVDGKEGREVSGELTEDKSHLFENRNQAAVPTEVRIKNMIIPGLSVIALILVYFIIKIKKRLQNAK